MTAALVLNATAGTAPLSGTLVVLGVIAASVGLFYAMNRSLRKVPKSFERPRPEPTRPEPMPPGPDAPREPSAAPPSTTPDPTVPPPGQLPG